MKNNALQKSTKELTDICSKYWQLIPKEVQEVIHSHVGVIENQLTDIYINPDMLPASWNKDEILKDTLKNYLSFLQKTGKIITPEIIKSCVNSIYIKTRDNTEQAVKAYNYSTIRGYMQPYVPDEKTLQLKAVDALPEANEIKEVFQAYFKGANITKELIAMFMDFNKWSNDTLKIAVTGKRLYPFIKELARLTDNYPGKVFTVLKYMAAHKLTEIPSDFAPILNWHNKQQTIRK